MSATFGIELEMSDCSISTAQARLNAIGLNWNCKPDGTRGVTAEAVSPILSHAALIEGSQAARALASAGATVNRQTGFHVHIGADYYGLNGIALLVQNWNLAHETIGALVAPSRLNNQFCKAVPLSEIDSWVEHVRNGSISNYRGGRYYSLNLAAYASHSTVEVRLHHGTLNGSKIKAWAEFVGAMAQFSADGNVLGSEYANLADREGVRLNKVNQLLTTLSENHLSVGTANYLKARAAELDAR
jgi:hypothetical protein